MGTVRLLSLRSGPLEPGSLKGNDGKEIGLPPMLPVSVASEQAVDVLKSCR